MIESTSLESERTELVKRLDATLKQGLGQLYFLSPDDQRTVASALRSLAAQDQKPKAWLQSQNGVEIVCKNRLDAGAFEFGWTEKPLYLSPPPAADWDQAIEACKKVAEKWLESFMGGEAYVARSIVNAIEALRHNAPPDSGATKSVEVPGVNAIDLANIPKQPVSGAPSSPAGHVLPDHGGADAGVRVKPLEWCDHSFKDSVLWIATTPFDDYRITKEDVEWPYVVRPFRTRQSNYQTLEEAKADCEADYERRVLSALSHQPAPVTANASEPYESSEAFQNCLGEMLRALGMFDGAQAKSPHDVFQSAIAEMKRRLANASAEARLRGQTSLAWQQDRGAAWDIIDQAISDYDGWMLDDDYDAMPKLHEIIKRMRERKALYREESTHPHASGCDKQEECCDLAAKEPCSDCPFPNPDAAMRGLTDLERTLLIASKAAQNYIANTESELGMTLKSGELLRAAIAKAEACEISAYPHASDKQGEW